ncbi:hypothetical protein [Chryseobacterium echinoideorum]|uniref:hypothetical protein n=1 Tax=Chryseobacterium echinoideorum TaxID=1549648 RepID=UPI0011850ECC|nr:hypothetical protein [Chryseobacterium echinoideorum]
MANLETILSWFETGDKPTQEEFKQTFSSFRNKDTKVPIAEVDGLESSLNNKLNVDDLPSNMALVDEGQPANVFNKEQIMVMAMMLSDYVKDGKIRADKIEALGLTDLIQVSENTLTEFAKNADKYEFQQNDFIAVPDDKGNFSLFIFKGEEKSDTKNYLPTGLTNITMGMVEGLQSALNTKLDKPEINGNYFVKMNGTASYQSINPGSDHLLFWNGSEFKNSNIFRESSGLKYGIGTTTPSEQLHLTSRARMSGLVLENNNETLPQQFTYNDKKFFGTDDSGVKRPLMFADNADFLSLANSLTDTQKTAWKTAMNGGWTTNTMSVAAILPTIVDKQDRNFYITLKGANLNLNPANFSIEIMNITGTTVIATIPNSQIQLYQNGVDLVFYYNFKNFPIGNYKLRLWNGVAYYVTNTTINIIDLLTPISLSGLNWSMLNNPTICPTVDVTTAIGTSIHRGRNTDEKFVGTNLDAVSYKSSVLIPAAIADGDFYLELTNVTFGVIYYDGAYGYDYGLVDASQPISHSMQILAGVRRNLFLEEKILPDNITVNGSNINTSIAINRSSKLYINKKGNVVSITSINNGQLTTSVSTWFQPNGIDLAFFVNFNSYSNSNSNNGANIQTDIYINSLIQL